MHEAVSRKLFDQTVEGLTAELCEGRAWKVHLAVYPTLDVEFVAPGRTPLRVRFGCDGWNGMPPTVTFYSSDGTALATLPNAPGSQFNSSVHPTVGRPFLCMVGSREYHTHPSHTGDLWDNYRERPGYDLGGLVTQIWRVWQAARP